MRINPDRGPAEKRLASQYGVRGYPSFFIQGQSGVLTLVRHSAKNPGSSQAETFLEQCRNAAR